MPTVRVTETELARDLRDVLEKVRQGLEVVVEEDLRPIAVIRTPLRPGRKISECTALAQAEEQRFNRAPVPDREFAGDVEAAIAERREPLDPTSWD
jgi:antitoxin (DNA-binding transcriptional repressor) of toxin-antitoxin stability system